jgi:phosphoglycerate dehydrogenase-like enzyme
MAALLARQVPFTVADAGLRRGEWRFQAGRADTLHGDLAGSVLGLIGYGHIGKAIASVAKPFGMRIHVANRSAVPVSGLVDAAWPLDRLGDFMATVDYAVASLPSLPETTGLIGAEALAALRPHAVIVNVGRGVVIDEEALFTALQARRIGGAVIDTWYVYPPAPGAPTHPSRFPFHELANVVMTPHMAAWSHGTIRRRRAAIAENINRLDRGEPLINVVATAGGARVSR